ncbi:MAG: glycine dehydrogenase (aminomethyl-transferring), partial [Acidimicrobiia bacterium]|nr:glycine dehydrogenase (aminomethyl-transferring) [Acidimicrobiia bacterium]
RRTSKKTVNAFFVDADTHPQTIAVLATRAEPLGIDLVVAERDGVLEGDFFGALFSYPTSTGSLADPRRHIAAAKDAGVVVVVVTDPLACVLVASPASLGADIAVGSAQRFGVPMGFGGPHAAFMATTDSMARSLPGRLVGVSTDTAGRPALRLALQTREQHIRREKATSNICTAQALLANMAGFYACWHGPEGLRRIATRVNRLASMFVEGVRSVGLTTVHDSWFDTVSVRVPGSALAVRDKARAAGFDVRVIDADTVSVTFDEVSDPDEVRSVLGLFGVETTHGLEGRLEGIRSDSRRVEPLLTARVFSAYRTEHEMLRYLRRLADKDLALDRTMIPLGSCTMKLNSTTEMEPITWPEFANVHPFAADDETAGYRELISDLESMLVTVTGYDAVSLQPNAGSQGEFAGLLAIRAYHRSRGDVARDVCLIPSSAHGTNAASAVMAGMSVV